MGHISPHGISGVGLSGCVRWRAWTELERVPLVEWTEGEVERYFDGLVAMVECGGMEQ